MYIYISFSNTNTGLMINKKYLLTTINDKKVQQKVYIDLC